VGLEELKKKFIVDEEEEKKRIEELLLRILPFARVTRDGYVHFERKNLSQIDRVALVLAARYLGGLLEDSISQEVNLGEIAAMTGVNRRVASARVADLSKEGLVDSVSRGRYRARGLFAVEKILDLLDKKYSGGSR